MTAQEAYDRHHERTFHDPPGEPPTGVDWDDPLEVLAIVAHAWTWNSPADVWSDVSAPDGRERFNKVWRQIRPSDRTLFRRRAGVALLACGAAVER